MKPDAILLEELIGLGVEVTKSTRRELIGLRGTIVDETLNTLTIECGGREKKIPKNCCTFRFGERGAEVDGRQLVHRPEDRIKKNWVKIKKAKTR